MKRISFLLAVLIFVVSCQTITREEVEATIWLNNFPPVDLCANNPDLANYGFYRKLDNGKIQFISMCKKEAKDMLAIPKADFQRILDKALPKPQPQNLEE